MVNDGELSSQLHDLLGKEGFVLFCQEFGGTRVYIPRKLWDNNDIVQAIGRERAGRLSAAFAPATIRVPLARRERALYWRAQGLSHGRIALKIGVTETAVNKLFQREESAGKLRPDRPTANVQDETG